MDGYEAKDTRLIVPGTLVTIEPGIYGPEIGTRTEINVAVHGSWVEVTTLPLQESILPLLWRYLLMDGDLVGNSFG